MQALEKIVPVVARMILFGVGILLASVSQFHGLDLNLGTFSGLALIVASLTPYSSPNDAQKIGGLLVLATSTILYMYFSVVILFTEKSEGLSVSDSLYLLPLVCLGYLTFLRLRAANEITENYERQHNKSLNQDAQ